MAKKKKADTSVESSLIEKFGENVIVSAKYITEKKKIIVPVSPMLDGVLNGGIPFGSFVIATGPPKVGKTSLGINMAANALGIPSEFEEDRQLYIFNIEARLNERDLMGVAALRPWMEKDRVHVIGSSREKIFDAEDYLEISEKLINEKPGSVFIFDSFSALCSREGKDKEWDGKMYRDNVPKALSHFVKRICNVIPINESIVFGVTHQIANTGLGFSPWAEASGTKIQYAVDVKLKATHKTLWKEGESIIGQDVHWECHCSPLQNGPVEQKCSSKLRFGYGIDEVSEMINIAVDLGIIKKGGAWYTLPDESKYQGLEKTRDALVENKELYNQIDKEYRELMGLPCTSLT